MTRVIQNFDTLATTPLRKDALTIAEAAYAAIDTDAVMRAALTLTGSMLRVGERSYDLSQYARLRVIGVGKASCTAMQTIEKILGKNIHAGIAIDIHTGVCEIADVLEGSHPHPTPQNVAASQKVVAMASDRTEKDLFIVIVSGGGSSLLCYPLDECEQGARLYEDMKQTDATIEDTNTIRKHISDVKGGGLAALLYPATVIGLIFCDIPGEKSEEVASGPTYLDMSTVADAQAVLDRYHLTGYTLKETPKDMKFFERIYNVPVVTNKNALAGMETAARALGYAVKNAGADLYDETALLVERMYDLLADKTVVIAGGEPRLKVTKSGGKGGRCQYAGLRALSRVREKDVFLALASDGRDNSDSAGAIVDAASPQKARTRGVDVRQALDSFDSYTFFEKMGDLLVTGPTGANVSDLFILIRG
jgi:glycerate-2-kinase